MYVCMWYLYYDDGEKQTNSVKYILHIYLSNLDAFNSRLIDNILDNLILSSCQWKKIVIA